MRTRFFNARMMTASSIIAVLSIHGGGVGAQTAQKQSASASPWEQDKRFSAAVSVPFSKTKQPEPLAASLTQWSQSSGVKLLAVPSLGDRRVFVCAKSVPLKRLLLACADVFGGWWQSADEAKAIAPFDGDYRLYLTDGAKETEARAIADSEQFEAALKAKCTAAMRRALDEAARKDDMMGTMLSQLDPEQQQRLADASYEPLGIISANDSRHLENHLFYATPSSQLSTGSRDQLGSLREETASDGTTFAPPPALRGASVGLIANDGIVSLGIVAADGKTIYMAPNSFVSRQPVPDLTDDDSHAEAVQAIQKGRLIEWGNLPLAKLKKKLRFAADLERRQLSHVLASISEQTGVPIVADDYLRSRKTPFTWLLTDKPEYTLDEALPQVLRAFAHRAVYRHGVLIVRTATPGLDLRAEPPANVIALLKQRTKSKEPLRLADFLVVGTLTPLQFDTLVVSHMEGIAPVPLTQASFAALRLYAKLNAEQKRLAEAGGLPQEKMRGEVRDLFMNLAHRGLPALSGTAGTVKSKGFVVRLPSGETGQVTFFVAPENAFVSRYVLNLPR